MEPFSECFLSGLLFSLGVGHFTDYISTPAIFSLYTTWWLTMDIILVYGLQVSVLAKNSFLEKVLAILTSYIILSSLFSHPAQEYLF